MLLINLIHDLLARLRIVAPRQTRKREIILRVKPPKDDQEKPKSKTDEQDIPIYSTTPPEHKIFDRKKSLCSLPLDLDWNWDGSYEQFKVARLLVRKLPALKSQLQEIKNTLKQTETALNDALDVNNPDSARDIGRRLMQMEKRIRRQQALIDLVENQQRIWGNLL